jgi:asparaginyl-tRNA synthetase
VLEGEVEADARAPGGFEIQVKGGSVLQAVEGFPISPRSTARTSCSQRHLWLRSKRQWALLRVRDAVITRCAASSTSAASCAWTRRCSRQRLRGHVDAVRGRLLRRKAYLTQSGQLYAEAAAMALRQGVLLRADVPRREVEDAPAPDRVLDARARGRLRDLEDMLTLAEDMLVHVVREVLRRAAPELAALERDLSKLESIQKPFPRITYDEAAAILKDIPSRPSSTATTSARRTRRSSRCATTGR